MNETTSPRRKWLVKTHIRRDLHPMAINSKLANEIHTKNQLKKHEESPTFNKISSSSLPLPETSLSVQTELIKSKNNRSTSIKKHPPPEASLDVQTEFIKLLEERHLHNRYLDLADVDGDGEIDTNWNANSWKKSNDKHYSACPILSPKKKPFSPSLFPGHETLHFVTKSQFKKMKRSRPKLSILTSPIWNGKQINPTSFSAPPGLKLQAPIQGRNNKGKAFSSTSKYNRTINGALKIVPCLSSTNRRNKIQSDLIKYNTTKWVQTHSPTVHPNPRSHPSYFQGIIDMSDKDQDYKKKWPGPKKHFYDKWLAHHHHGTFGDASGNKTLK
jgi:hypothetical protein